MENDKGFGTSYLNKFQPQNWRVKKMLEGSFIMEAILLFQVQFKGGPTKTFAWKKMKKVHLVDVRQQDHIMSEKRIMMESNSPFIVKYVEPIQCIKLFYIKFLIGNFHFLQKLTYRHFLSYNLPTETLLFIEKFLN
jgi:hypothetical protein